jgi:hypothetical protein
MQRDSKEAIHFREDKELMSEIRKEMSVRAGIVRRGVFTSGMHEAMRVYLGFLRAQNKQEKTIISFQNLTVERSEYRDAIQLREEIIRYMIGRRHWNYIPAPPATMRISLLHLREAIGIVKRQKSRTDGLANWRTIDGHMRRLKKWGVIKDDGKVNSFEFCNPENADDEGIVASMVERQYEIIGPASSPPVPLSQLQELRRRSQIQQQQQQQRQGQTQTQRRQAQPEKLRAATKKVLERFEAEEAEEAGAATATATASQRREV